MSARRARSKRHPDSSASSARIGVRNSEARPRRRVRRRTRSPNRRVAILWSDGTGEESAGCCGYDGDDFVVACLAGMVMVMVRRCVGRDLTVGGIGNVLPWVCVFPSARARMVSLSTTPKQTDQRRWRVARASWSKQTNKQEHCQRLKDAPLYLSMTCFILHSRFLCQETGTRRIALRRRIRSSSSKMTKSI